MGSLRSQVAFSQQTVLTVDAMHPPPTFTSMLKFGLHCTVATGIRSRRDQIQERFAEMAPRQLGNMGYYGATAMYIPLKVLEQGYESEGINLDFYRDYNMSKKNPGKFFAAPSDLSDARLRPCNETALMWNEAGGKVGLKKPNPIRVVY